jgi:nucleoside-diphosphate-sugar epimerase
MKVLVTGAGGVLGGLIVTQLRRTGHEVIGAGRRPHDGIDILWDVAAQAAPEPDLVVDAVVHAAARIGGYRQAFTEALPLFETNELGTLRVAQWCSATKVEKLVLISGAIVYGHWGQAPKYETDPAEPWKAGPYAASKYAAELCAALVREAGCALSILRLSSLYGVGYTTGLIPRLLRTGHTTGQIKIAAPFEDAFDLLHSADATRTICRAVEQAGDGLWNVGAGKLTTIRELAETCACAVGAKFMLEETAPKRAPQIINWVNDDKARTKLDHTTSVSLAAGIAESARMAATASTADQNHSAGDNSCELHK